MKNRDRELLRLALLPPEFDSISPVDSLLERLPALLAEVRRRRAVTAADAAFAAARMVLPRLGWATAAAVLLAAVAWGHRPTTLPTAPRAASAWEDQLILSGSVGPNGPGPLVQALAADDAPDAGEAPR